MTDRQWEDFSEKCIRDETKKKELFLKQECELLETLVKSQMMACISPVGRDRAFRRYWVFTCIPGLFIEDNDLRFMGKCLTSPTPYNPELQPEGPFGVPNMTLASMREYLERTNGISSDKENEEGSEAADDKATLKKGNKIGGEIGLSEKNGDHKEVVSQDDGTDDLKMAEVIDKTPIFGMCTANEETCPVHSTEVDRCEWNVFRTVESIENLISSLNPRGNRERELLDNLKNEKWRLYDHLASCPSDVVPLLKAGEAKGVESTRLTSKVIELNVRDSIVDLEEKIYHGTLGKLKVS